MARTRLHGQQVKDGSIELVDLSQDLQNDLSQLQSDVSTLQSDVAAKPDTSALATVATSGSYNDLLNLPSLFSGSYADLTNKPVLFSGSYNDLSDKPSLFDGNYSSLSGAPVLATVATSGSYNDLSDLPSLFSGDYNDLLNKPTLFSGAYADLTGKPTLFSGSYNDLSDKPTLGSLSGSIDDLSDVTITSASNNQYLRFNGSAWVNTALPVASGGTAGIVDGNFQIFSGTKRFSTVQTGYIESPGTTLTMVGITGGTVAGASIGLVGNSADGYINFGTKNQQYVGPITRANINKDGLFSMYYGASISSGDAAVKGLIIKGAASQSANLFEVQNSSSTVLFSIDSAGSVAAGTVPVARVTGLHAVATSGSYNDLSDKPTIPSITGLATESYVDSAVAAVVNSAPAVLDTLNELAAALGNDENFATTVAGQIGDVAADVSALDTRVTAVEGDISDLQTDVAAKADSASLATVATSGSYNDLLNLPTLFSGSYDDLSNKPSLVSSLDDLSDVTITSPSSDQVLKYNGTAWVNATAPATFSGSYNDLSDKPTIPTNLDSLTDVAITSAAKGQLIVHNGTEFVNSNTVQAANDQLGLIVKTSATPTGNGQYPFWIQDSAGGNKLFVRVSDNAQDNYTIISNRLGIGSQDRPGNQLNVHGGAIQLTYGSESPSYLNGSRLRYDGGSFQIGSMASVPMYFATANTNRAHFGTDGSFSVYKTTQINSGAAANKGLIVQGAASQTANLVEVQNSSGTINCAIADSGAITTASNFTVRANNSSQTKFLLTTGAGIGANLTNRGFVMLHQVSAETQMDFMTTADASETLSESMMCFNLVQNQVGFNTPRTSIGGQVHITSKAAARKGLIVKGAASQTANLFEAQDSSGSALFTIDKDGSVAAGTVPVARVSGLASVATSGDYADLSNKPTVYTPTKEVLTSLVDGTETEFVLAATPNAGAYVQVFVNGLLQSEGASEDYTISGDTITFNTAPESGWKLIVCYFV